MKKNLFYLLAVTLFMGLFASCSQEETPGLSEGKSKLVRIGAQLPVEFAKVRALPTANEHQLRCILEVWSKETTPNLIYRSEKLGADASNDKISFEFSLEAGTYDCLMWADFIATDAALTDERYADKYYNTSDLKKVTIKDASLLYNSDACDAFFASQVLDKNDTQEMQTFDATLKRPFAKLIVSDKNKKNFGLCKKVSVSHKVAESFNVAEGEASTTTVTSVLTDVAPIGAGDADLRLFSCYAFADTDGALKEIALTFKDESGTELRSTAIPAGVAFQRNRQTKASGHLVAEATNNTTVDVGVSDDWEADITEDDVNPVEPTPGVEDPKVGSFYYSDGTWSEVLNEKKTCVGVIFALANADGSAKDDNISNYAGSVLTQINGWVIAADNAGAGKTYYKDGEKKVIDITTTPGSAVSQDATDFLGYKNTQAFKGLDANMYQAALSCLDYSITLTGATSGWYLPSAGQMKALQSVYCENTGTAKAVKSALQQLVDKTKGTLMSDAYYWASTIDANGKACRAGFAPTTIDAVGATDTNKGSVVRPILTF